jgi:hypothetical protein
MTHRDGFPRFSARSAWRGDAGHREPRGTLPESLGKPPFRSRGRTAGVRREALTMPRIACGSLPTRRLAHAISMGHYQRSLVLGPVLAISGGSGHRLATPELPPRTDIRDRTSAFLDFRRLYLQLRTLRMAVPLVRR